MQINDRLTVAQAMSSLGHAAPDAELWVIGPDEKPTPASAVFRGLDPRRYGGERVYIVARPWLEVPDGNGAAA